MENKKLVKEKPLYPQWPGLSIYTQVTLDKSKIVGFRWKKARQCHMQTIASTGREKRETLIILQS